MAAAPDVDWGAVYRECIDATVRIAEAATPEQLATPVPATPDWNVRDLLGHAAGGAGDLVGGRMDGAPSPDWTARHVAERASRTVAELIDELRRTEQPIADLARASERPAMVWDKSVHLADLHEALGLGTPPEATWGAVADGVTAWRLAEVPVTVRCGDSTFGAGGTVIDVDRYELFRAVFSRRSRAQMREWAGAVLSDEQLDALPVFGPRTDDQPRP